MDNFAQYFGQWVLRHRWWVIIGTMLIVSMVACGMQRLKFVNESRIFFSKKNPQLQALETLENTYTKDDNVLFALAPKNGNVFTRQTLAAIEDLMDKRHLLDSSSKEYIEILWENARAGIQPGQITKVVLRRNLPRI